MKFYLIIMQLPKLFRIFVATFIIKLTKTINAYEQNFTLFVRSPYGYGVW